MASTLQTFTGKASLEEDTKYRTIFENASEGIFQTTPEEGMK